MTDQMAFSGTGFMNAARAVLAAMIAAALVALGFVLAAFLTMTALIVAGVGLLGVSAYWLYAKVRGPRRRPGPTILVARRGPHGWTVDGEEARGA